MESFNRLCALFAHILLLIGASILSLMMFLIMADVLLRYVFGKPISGAYEIAQYMMAIVIPFGIVYCAHEKGHVSVDVIVSILPDRFQAVLGCVASLIVFILFSVIAWQNILYVGENYQAGYTSPILYIPAYPFVGTIALGFAVLCLVLLVDLLNAFFDAVRK